MLPVAIVEASGDQLTTSTQLVWPFSVFRGVPVSQSHNRAVESPLPVKRMEEVAGEKAVARMASPWPGIEDEHRETARTLKTACGVYCKRMNSSVVLMPGFNIEW